MTNLNEYDSTLSEIRAQIGKLVLATVNPFKAVELSAAAWLKILADLFPKVDDARWAASGAARDFYDAERLEKVGERRDTYLSTYDPDDFQAAMEDYRADISKKYEPEEEKRWVNTVSGMAGGVIREVDNGARLTLAEATIADDAAGFARIDPQPPSCAFCTMLISRGPAYTAEEFQKNTFAYHPFDTCILVPVFDEDDWPGKDQYEEAERLYREAAKKDGDTLKNLRDMV